MKDITDESPIQNITIAFDSNVYSLKAVKRAVSDFGDRFVMIIETGTDNKVQVHISPSQSNPISKNDIKEFKRILSDHQIYLDIEDDFKTIREIIVAQAFFPCDNLEIIVGQIYHDRKI